MTNLEHYDEGQPRCQDMPELQSEFIWSWTPWWGSVISIPVNQRKKQMLACAQKPEYGEELSSLPQIWLRGKKLQWKRTSRGIKQKRRRIVHNTGN